MIVVYGVVCVKVVDGLNVSHLCAGIKLVH